MSPRHTYCTRVWMLSVNIHTREGRFERGNSCVFVDMCSCVFICFVCCIHWCLPHVYVPVSACGNQHTHGIGVQVVTVCWRWSIVMPSYSPLVCLLAWSFLYMHFYFFFQLNDFLERYLSNFQRFCFCFLPSSKWIQVTYEGYILTVEITTFIAWLSRWVFFMYVVSF